MQPDERSNRSERSFAEHLTAFFQDWLVTQRGASVNTIRSYRDAWCQFLQFVSSRTRRSVAQIEFDDLSSPVVHAFLQSLAGRGVTTSTRNLRLAAIHSFFGFVARREPRVASHCRAILDIPMKRSIRRAIAHLEVEEVDAILGQADRSTIGGRRDYLLVLLLFNTGGRIEEVLNLRLADVRLDPPAQVKFLGKGRRERVSPIWPETARQIKAFIKRSGTTGDDFIFLNRYGRRLTSGGARFNLAKYVRRAARVAPSLSTKRVTPHLFRHTCAMQLVGAGVDIAVISNWLGHAHLDTTSIYARASLEAKRKALAQLEKGFRPQTNVPWKKGSALLDWLRAL
jgi:site-specific recombinase XerD